MIDVRAARNDLDGVRTALARRGAAEAFDDLIAADTRWRELLPQVEELRGKQKLQGKPTPEQLEELRTRKERLTHLEAQLASAEAERDSALAKVPNPPHDSAADGMTEDEAGEITRGGAPPQIAEPKEHTEIGDFDLERGAKVSGSRFGFILGDTALVALAGYRLPPPPARARGARGVPARARPARARGLHAGAPARARARGRDVRHRLLPVRQERLLRDPRRQPLPRRHVRGAVDRDAHGRDPRDAAALLLRVLVVLPPRVGGRRA